MSYTFQASSQNLTLLNLSAKIHKYHDLSAKIHKNIEVIKYTI
jgi:hypothetical protein